MKNLSVFIRASLEMALLIFKKLAGRSIALCFVSTQQQIEIGSIQNKFRICFDSPGGRVRVSLCCDIIYPPGPAAQNPRRWKPKVLRHEHRPSIRKKGLLTLTPILCKYCIYSIANNTELIVFQTQEIWRPFSLWLFGCILKAVRKKKFVLHGNPYFCYPCACLWTVV